jgi:hypothetical protein
MNHLLIAVKLWFDDSTRKLISGSAINTLASPANITGVETELILGGRSLLYNRKSGGPSIKP